MQAHEVLKCETFLPLSTVCEKHTISTTLGYRTLTVFIATLLEDAQSLKVLKGY